MARRAQQGSVAHCPYCEAFLPQVASECPECRFPLTLAAADFGFRAPDHSGTTSTATPGGRAAAALVPGGHGSAERRRIHGSRASRMRLTAWLLGLTSILLLLAGVGALFTASSPAAQGDREATANLLTALRRATDDPNHRREVTITPLDADVASTKPQEVSIDQEGGSWYAAAMSTSGRCIVLARRLTDGAGLPPGTFRRADQPCTGAQVRLLAADGLAKAKG